MVFEGKAGKLGQSTLTRRECLDVRLVITPLLVVHEKTTVRNRLDLVSRRFLEPELAICSGVSRGDTVSSNTHGVQ